MSDQTQIEQSDPDDPLTIQKVAKIKGAAREALQLIVRRHRKNPPETCFELTLNTVGVMAAEMVFDAIRMERGSDLTLAKDVADVVRQHITSALKEGGAKP